MAVGALDQTGSYVTALCFLEELGRGEEDAFSFRRRRPSSNVHLEAKMAKVVEDEVHALRKVFSRSKWECAIVYVEALEDFVGGECLCCAHCWCVTTYFSLNHIVVAGSHDLEDGDALFAPYDFQCFGESCHEEEEEDGGYVVSLAHANCLGYFDFLFFNF
jgi:hypothetical protein